jgi:putative amino-acid transport system permease protein
MLEVLPSLFYAGRFTLYLTLVASFFGLIIGLILAVISYYEIKILNPIAKVYLFVMRGAPLVALLYFFYYGLASYSDFVSEMNPLNAVSIIISLTAGGFMAESIRGALISVEEGQKDAAYSLGLTNAELMRRVIIPQAVRIAVPSLFNNVISITKMTSLSFMLGVVDIMGAARLEGSRTFSYFEIYGGVIIVYLVLVGLLMLVQRYVARKSSEAY